MTTSTQFKTLVQNELSRLEAIIVDNESVTASPTLSRTYGYKKREGILIGRKPSRYHGFLALMRVMQFLF